MDTINVEVKSQGKLLTTLPVEQFDEFDEAVNHYQTMYGEDPDAASKAKKDVLSLINSQHRANVTNAERVRLTRGVSPIKVLRERVKADPNAKQLLESVLAQLGIDASGL